MRVSKLGVAGAVLMPAIGIVLSAFAGPAGAQPVQAKAAQSAKPAPAPSTSPTAAPHIVPKPAHSGGTVTPLTAYTVQINEPIRAWAGTSATLVATTNLDVTTSPYWIDILDGDTLIAHCGGGTSCSATVSSATPKSVYYVARVERADRTDIQASAPCPAPGGGFCGSPSVTWFDATVQLSADQPTVGVGGTVNLTATTSDNVGPSPYWIQIYDDNTGTVLAQCPSGTTCPATVSALAAGTHRYRAYVSANTTANPPTNIHGTSLPAFVTASNNGYRVTLNWGFNGTYWYNLTANVNQDVTQKQYWLEIFNTKTGKLVTQCQSANTCSYAFVDSSSRSDPYDFTAFLSPYSASFPPPGAQANTNNVHFTTYPYIP
jgi:hypothetical protein